MMLPIGCRKPILQSLGGLLGRSERLAPRIFVLLTVILFLIDAAPLSAGLLPGNIWPNPTLESDVNVVGVPDFWNLGGSDTTIDVWSTALSVSPTHSLELNDTSTTAYGEWYSNLLNINGGATYQFRYNLYYIVTNVGPMRVTVNFYNSANSLFSSLSYTFAGMHDFWEEITQQFTAPADCGETGPYLHFRRWFGRHRSGVAGRHFPGRGDYSPIRSCRTSRTFRRCQIPW